MNQDPIFQVFDNQNLHLSLRVGRHPLGLTTAVPDVFYKIVIQGHSGSWTSSVKSVTLNTFSETLLHKIDNHIGKFQC